MQHTQKLEKGKAKKTLKQKKHEWNNRSFIDLMKQPIEQREEIFFAIQDAPIVATFDGRDTQGKIIKRLYGLELTNSQMRKFIRDMRPQLYVKEKASIIDKVTEINDLVLDKIKHKLEVGVIDELKVPAQTKAIASAAKDIQAIKAIETHADNMEFDFDSIQIKL